MKLKTAVILVAGVGSRLRPLTDDRPKALVSVAGETILGRASRLLIQAGMEKLVLATGYRQDSVERAMRGLDVEVVYCENPDFAGTQNSVSLALCRHTLEGLPFLKLDGDVVFEPEVLDRVLQGDDEDLVVLVDSKRERDAEAMKIRADGARILEFGKGIPLASSHAETVGIERLGAHAGSLVFGAIERHVAGGERGLYYEDVYSELVARRAISARAVEVGDLRWTEVDTPEDLERARGLLGRGA
jgi:choline kinase